MAMIWRGFYFYRRRMDRRRVLRALAFLLMALALTVLFIAATQMRPLLESMATTRVSNTVTRIVSEAVYEAIEKGELQYDGLVSLRRTRRATSPLCRATWRPSTTCRRRFWTRS